jgi:hypothetical protein
MSKDGPLAPHHGGFEGRVRILIDDVLDTVDFLEDALEGDALRDLRIEGRSRGKTLTRYIVLGGAILRGIG